METDLSSFGRIGVLMGGPSSEREISLASGKAVYESLKSLTPDIVALDILTDSRQENLRLIQQSGIDIAFIALHGRFGEDGQVQALLEEMNIPYSGSDPAASRLAMDKIASRRIFQEQGLPVPDYVSLCARDDLRFAFEISGHLSPPLVVKPCRQGSSIGLSIIEGQEELKSAIEYAVGFDEEIIIEEYIPGKEITVGILGDSPLPVVEIIPKKRFYDYEAKYKAGQSNYAVPADLPVQVTSRVQDVAHCAHKFLGCWGFSRVDMRLNPDNKPFVLEVNSIPGLTMTSLLPKAAKAAGMDFVNLCVFILRLAYERSAKE
ncbi:D-alanine--D-alanine ligase [Candidatus Omnitrophota bacterium]